MTLLDLEILLLQNDLSDQAHTIIVDNFWREFSNIGGVIL